MRIESNRAKSIELEVLWKEWDDSYRNLWDVSLWKLFEGCEELDGLEEKKKKKMPHDSGEAGEQSETEGGAMQSIALSLSYITQSYRFAPPSVSKLTAPPNHWGSIEKKENAMGFI